MTADTVITSTFADRVAVAPDPEPMLGVVLVAVGGVCVVLARLGWRGWEPRKVRAWIRENGLPVPGIAGAFTQYQSLQGSAYLMMIAAPGLVIVGLAELLAWANGSPAPDRSGWIFIVFSVTVSPCGLALLAYFWIGLPDRFRPPAQRGFEIVRGEYLQVRDPRGGRTADQSPHLSRSRPRVGAGRGRRARSSPR